MLSFAIRKDELQGIQIDCSNNYYVSRAGYEETQNGSCRFKNCVIGISKVADHCASCPVEEAFPCPIIEMEDVTSFVMEKMGYVPSAFEIENKVFLGSLNQYFEILQFVKNLDIQ